MSDHAERALGSYLDWLHMLIARAGYESGAGSSGDLGLRRGMLVTAIVRHTTSSVSDMGVVELWH